MNLLKRELRANWKAFFFWSIGMFVLCFAGVVKFESYTASGSMMELLNSFPRIVLAVMGAVGVDMGSLNGYIALMFYYVLICACIYALHLGSFAVSRESVDKTYEFLFTKPRSRSHLLGVKIIAAYIYFAVFCLVSGAFVLSLAACFSAYAMRPEKGAALGNLAFLAAFVLGVVYNLLEKPGLLRLVSPISYFPASKLAEKTLSLPYSALALVLSGVFLVLAFRRFDKKDLL